MEELSLSATFIKAALVRSVWDEDLVIGRNTTATQKGIVINQVYTADFRQEKNLVFVDRFYLPRMWEIVQEGRKRQMPVGQMFGEQALYAIGIKTVTDYSFNELSSIIHPVVQNQQNIGVPMVEASNVTRLFPQRAIVSP